MTGGGAAQELRALEKCRNRNNLDILNSFFPSRLRRGHDFQGNVLSYRKSKENRRARVPTPHTRLVV